jgi:hypothetical protein
MQDGIEFQQCDENVKSLAIRLRPHFEQRLQKTFSRYEPETYTSKNDNENLTTYYIKLNLGDGINGEVQFKFDSSNETFQIMKTELNGNLGEMDLV